jgi:hypothetical protein
MAMARSRSSPSPSSMSAGMALSAGGPSVRLLAWYGDTELMPHLLDILNGGPVDVRLVWGEPIRMGREHSRKEATRPAAEVRHAVRMSVASTRPGATRPVQRRKRETKQD